MVLAHDKPTITTSKRKWCYYAFSSCLLSSSCPRLVPWNTSLGMRRFLPALEAPTVFLGRQRCHTNNTVEVEADTAHLRQWELEGWAEVGRAGKGREGCSRQRDQAPMSLGPEQGCSWDDERSGVAGDKDGDKMRRETLAAGFGGHDVPCGADWFHLRGTARWNESTRKT